jgi:DNA mismatch endonuclease Vsr
LPVPRGAGLETLLIVTHPERPLPRPDFTAVPAARRKNMAAIRGVGTKPEMLVRRTAHALGYRFRLHAKDLPGRPDLVFPGRHKVIFVHGCFWHRHGCRHSVLPRTRQEWWQAKLEGNAARDRRDQDALRALGWRVLVLWECELRDVEGLRSLIVDFLGARPSSHAPAVVASGVSSSSRRDLSGGGVK